MVDPLYDHGAEVSPPQKRVQKMIGMVLWVARNTRPEISYAVSRLGTRVSRWNKTCDRELCRLVGYLKHTKDMALQMRFAKADNGEAAASVYSDANLASPASQSGHLVCLESANGTLVPIAWRSTKQSICADSTGASELIAAHYAVKESMMLASSLQRGPVVLKVDNSAVLRNAMRGSSKQLEWLSLAIRLRIGMLRDLRELGLVKTEYVASALNLADIFSKALLRVKFEQQREMIGVVAPRRAGRW